MNVTSHGKKGLHRHDLIKTLEMGNLYRCAQCNQRVLKSGKGRHKNIQGRCNVAGSEDGGSGSQATECKRPAATGKGNDLDSPLESP